jgi:hypothetical protein
MAICRLEHAAQLWKGGTEGPKPKAGRSLFLMRNLLRVSGRQERSTATASWGPDKMGLVFTFH